MANSLVVSSHLRFLSRSVCGESLRGLCRYQRYQSYQRDWRRNVVDSIPASGRDREDLRQDGGVATVSADERIPGEALKDRFQRQHTYLRISLTERCNLRCELGAWENERWERVGGATAMLGQNLW